MRNNETVEAIISGFLVQDWQYPVKKHYPVLMAVDLQGKEICHVPLDFSAHHVFPHPLDPSLFMVSNKTLPEMGQKAALVSFKDKTARHFDPSPEATFYGHSQFFDEGKYFVSTERFRNSRGKIVIRETESLKILQSYSLPGFGPHDCHLMSDGKSVAVSMDGITFAGDEAVFGKSSILIVDLSSGKVINESVIEDAGHLAGHLTVSKEDDIVTAMVHIGKDRSSSCIASGKAGEKFLSWEMDPELKTKIQESLSICLDEKRKRALVTFPYDGVVAVWNFKTKKFEGQIRMPSPHGVSVNSSGDLYTVSNGEGFLFDIDPEKLAITGLHAPERNGHRLAHHLYVGNFPRHP